MNRYANSETIIVVRPAGHDQWGDPTPATEHTITDVVRYPRSSGSGAEDRNFQNSSITGYTLLLPGAADLRPTDRVRLEDEPTGSDPWRAATWAVIGEVSDYRYPFSGWEPGGVAMIERVS